MPSANKPRKLSPSQLHLLHEIIIRAGAAPGVLSDGLPQICLDFPYQSPYGKEQYRGLFRKAAALLYAIVQFHPFIDGNKRTALLATSLFLAINGYRFNYPRDSAQYVLAIARDKINEVAAITKWLNKNSTRIRKISHKGLLITADVGYGLKIQITITR